MANKNPYEWQQHDDESPGVLEEYVQAQQQLEIQRYNTSIRRARNWLFASAALFVIIVLIQVGDRMHLLTPGITAVLFGYPAILIMLGLLTPKNPSLCLTIALMLYIGFYVVMMVFTQDVRWLYGGILIKVVVVLALLKGLMAAREADRLKKDHPALSQKQA